MTRNWIFGSVLVIVVAAGVAPAVVPATRSVPLGAPLAQMAPTTLGAWGGGPAETGLSVPGAEVLRRRYVREGGDVVDLEIRHYPGGVPHSPLLPLPGPEWERNLIEMVPLETTMGPVIVNRVLVATAPTVPERKERVLVYWYHERGRIVAKETLAKLLRMQDRLFRGRIEGTLVSVSIDARDGQHARDRVTEFARLALPVLKTALSQPAQESHRQDRKDRKDSPTPVRPEGHPERNLSGRPPDLLHVSPMHTARFSADFACFAVELLTSGSGGAS